MLDIGLRYSIPTSNLLTDLDVKVTDLEVYMINEISISDTSVIRTTDPRVHAMGCGWRSKYRTSSYSSDIEFIFVFFPSNAF